MTKFEEGTKYEVGQARKTDPNWDAHNALGDDAGQLSDICMKQRAEAYAKEL